MDKQSSPAPFSDSFLNLYNGWRLLASFSKTIHALVFVIIRTLWQPAKLSSRVEHSKFSSLPPELMEAVLRELEWNDVLHARVTCRSLYVASKGLVIWRRLFHRLSDSYAAPIFPPKPLEAYTAHELENLVTRWLRADSLWSPSVPRDPPAFRHVRQASALSYVVLVEGGRWLLTSDECDKGAICFHLLDSLDSQIGPTVLIKDPDEAFMTSMHAIVDHSSPTLTFDLAVVYDDRVGATVHGRVEIWRVIETEDATLSPTRITEFITPIPDEVELHTSLLGPLFARFDGYNYIEIYDWTKSRANTHCKCVIRATCRGNDVVEMKLLPGRKMLLIGQKTFSVISIPDLSTYSAEHTMPAPHEPTPLFHWEVDGLVSQRRRGFTTSTSIKIKHCLRDHFRLN
ncbi:hypothetical protein ONZ45_g1103 [Pleurotus djamor]|nr:hypothetical protein ONZ45_g1103 [Pleurotus djamor]